LIDCKVLLDYNFFFVIFSPCGCIANTFFLAHSTYSHQMPNDNYEFYLYTKKRHKPFLVTQTHEIQIQTEQRNKTENEQLKLGSQGLLGSVSVSGFSSIFCLSVCLSGWRSIYLSIYLSELAPSTEESPLLALLPAPKAKQEIQVIAAVRRAETRNRKFL